MSAEMNRSSKVASAARAREGEGGESEASGGKMCEARGEEAEIEAELRDAGRKF